MSTRENKAIVLRYLRSIGSGESGAQVLATWAAPDRPFFEQGVDEDLSYKIRGPLTVEDVIAEADRVVVRFHGTFVDFTKGPEEAGRVLDVESISIFRMHAGRI